MSPAEAPTAAPGADEIARGVCRLLRDLGCETVREFPLVTGRRANVAALDRRGRLTLVEIKSSPADWRADRKWPDYLSFADTFYFAVGPEFPRELLPAESGLIIADAFAGAIVRAAPVTLLGAARRLGALLDPPPGG